MARIRIDNESGRWFDTDKAEYYDEDTYWDGHNYISKATGSQWEHETLWITKGGTIILHAWSDYQGSVSSYNTIDEGEAAEWFIKNEYRDDQLPERFRKEVEAREVD